MIQRPRALQYTYKARRIEYGDDAAPISHERSHTSELVKYTAEGVSKARERVDLFIDLVWVGIISNISEVFSSIYFEGKGEAGLAFLNFMLIFLPAWRLWNFLREFLNMYYMDDTLQRLFVFWILVLSVFFGNQVAYYVEDFDTVKSNAVSIYLFARASFLIMELIYSIWIPWLRKLIFAGSILAMPSTAMWIAVIYLPAHKAVVPAVLAVVWEYSVPLLLETPLGDALLPGEYRKEIDPIHLRGRMGSFLLITIGEGVLMIVRGGPLGVGFNGVTALAVWTLMIYFILAYLYFARDQSIRYIPAVRHKGWRLVLWVA